MARSDEPDEGTGIPELPKQQSSKAKKEVKQQQQKLQQEQRQKQERRQGPVEAAREASSGPLDSHERPPTSSKPASVPVRAPVPIPIPTPVPVPASIPKPEPVSVPISVSAPSIQAPLSDTNATANSHYHMGPFKTDMGQFRPASISSPLVSIPPPVNAYIPKVTQPSVIPVHDMKGSTSVSFVPRAQPVFMPPAVAAIAAAHSRQHEHQTASISSASSKLASPHPADFYCTCCSISANSISQWNEHVSSSRHRRNAVGSVPKAPTGLGDPCLTGKGNVIGQQGTYMQKELQGLTRQQEDMQTGGAKRREVQLLCKWGNRCKFGPARCKFRHEVGSLEIPVH